MMASVQAGEDSAASGTLVGMILGAAGAEILAAWQADMRGFANRHIRQVQCLVTILVSLRL